MRTLVFDIGGTNTRAAFVTEEGIGDVTHVKTPASPHDTIAQLAAFGPVDKAVGGIASIVDMDGDIVTATNLPRWNGFPFDAALEEALGAPVALHNDAELAALGEAVYGAGKGKSVVAYIGLGTGVGTALVKDRVVVPGSSDGSERVSVITLLDGTTLEEHAGGRLLEKRYGALPSSLPREIWDVLAPLLAESVRNAVREWHPDAVVLGGSLMNEENGFRLGDVTAAVGKDNTPIYKAELGDEAGLWGARALASP